MEIWIKLLLEWTGPLLKTLIYLQKDHELFQNTPFQTYTDKLEKTKIILENLEALTTTKPEIPQLKQNPSPKPKTSQIIENINLSQLLTDTPNLSLETLQQLAQQQQQNQIQLTELNHILQSWPLPLTPNQLLNPSNTDSPLKIIINLPPQETLKQYLALHFDIKHISIFDLTPSISESIRNQITQHHHQSEFLGTTLPNQFQGETTIKKLHSLLNSQPHLIIETELDTHYIYLRLGYWPHNSQQYHYLTLHQIPYQLILLESLKNRAQKWKNTLNQLQSLNKPIELIQQLGKTNIHNLTQLELETQLKQEGIDIWELDLKYQINQNDLEELIKHLIILHQIIITLINDLHQLIHHQTTPIAPQILSNYPTTLVKETITKLTPILTQHLTTHPQPHLITLQLAQTFLQLAQPTLAKQQLQLSVHHWLNHQPDNHPNHQPYLETIKNCLIELQEEQTLNQLQPYLSSIIPQRIQFNQTYRTKTLWGYSGKPNTISITPDGNTLISTTSNNTIEHHQLDPINPNLISTLNGHQGTILAIALSSDGQILACSDRTSQRSQIRIWSLQKLPTQTTIWSPLRTLFGHKKPINALAISPNSADFPQTLLASASHKIKIWKIQTGEPLWTLYGHNQKVQAIAFSPVGQTLASSSEDKTIKLWDIRTGEWICTLTGHTGAINNIAITPDGQTLISASQDQTIKIWQLHTGKLLTTIKAHQDSVGAIAITPDGKHLISGSRDQTLKLWEIDTGKLIQTIAQQTGKICAILISPKDSTLITATEDKTLQLWFKL